MNSHRDLSRRELLRTTLLSTGGLALLSAFSGCEKGRQARPNSQALDAEAHAQKLLEVQLGRELQASSQSAGIRGAWTAGVINELIHSMGEDALKRMSYTLDLSANAIGSAGNVDGLRALVMAEMSTLTRWKSLPGTAESIDKVNYHERILLPAAHLVGVPAARISDDSFILERAISEETTINQFQAMNRDYRWTMIKGSHWSEDGLDGNTMAGLVTGTIPLRSLLASAGWTKGFRFYRGLISGIGRVLQSMDISLPFGEFCTDLLAIRTMTAPYGLASTAIMGFLKLMDWYEHVQMTDDRKRLALVMQVHSYRACALTAAGIPLPS